VGAAPATIGPLYAFHCQLLPAQPKISEGTISN
jgi:hypothetical protein